MEPLTHLSPTGVVDKRLDINRTKGRDEAQAAESKGKVFLGLGRGIPFGVLFPHMQEVWGWCIHGMLVERLARNLVSNMWVPWHKPLLS